MDDLLRPYLAFELKNNKFPKISIFSKPLDIFGNISENFQKFPEIFPSRRTLSKTKYYISCKNGNTRVPRKSSVRRNFTANFLLKMFM